MNILRHAISNLLGVSVFCLLFTSCTEKTPIEPNNYPATVVSHWNNIVMEKAIAEDGLLTLKGVRTEAIMHLAMHNALNTINPVYTKFHSHSEDQIQADPIAAVAQAAFKIAVNQYPDEQSYFEEELSKWLSENQDGTLKEEGIKLGNLAAEAVLNARTEDNWNGESDYTWHPMAPGVYAEFNEHSGTPQGFIFGAGWAEAIPFMLSSQDQFRSQPPPEISSDEYTAAFNEVSTYGSHDSQLRSNDQAHLAMWWKDFVENSHNRLARKLVEKEKLNLWQASRLFALLNMAIFDAYISVFDNKFHYNHWRPYTAIRWAEHDENPNTKQISEWNNLHKHTYAFPSYPSAHGTASTAAMTVLAHTLGTGDEYQFTMTTDSVDQAGPFSNKVKMDPPTRSFDSFSEAGMEASMSRVYLGIHFRYDSEAGFELGREVGNYASQNFLTPL